MPANALPEIMSPRAVLQARPRAPKAAFPVFSRGNPGDSLDFSPLRFRQLPERVFIKTPSGYCPPRGGEKSRKTPLDFARKSGGRRFRTRRSTNPPNAAIVVSVFPRAGVQGRQKNVCGAFAVHSGVWARLRPGGGRGRRFAPPHTGGRGCRIITDVVLRKAARMSLSALDSIGFYRIPQNPIGSHR